MIKKLAVIYDRASTKMQKDNWSRVNAKDEGIRIAEFHGFMWEYVKEIGSGTTLSGRPEMLKILDRIAAGEVQAIIVQELDRLARPTERAVYETIRTICIKYDVIVYTHSGIYDFADDDSDFVADINMAVAKKETRRTRKRLKRGKMAKAKSGGYIGGHPPLGYKVVYVDNEGQKPLSDLAIDENENELSKVVFDTIEATGGNLGRTAIRLNEMGYKGKRGGKFSPNTVRQIAQKQIYIGLIQNAYTDKVIHRPELQIISVSQFERVQQLIKSRKVGTRDSGTRGSYPFTGFIICGNCGGSMVAANQKKNGLIYSCVNRRKYGKAACPHSKHYKHDIIADAMTTFLADFINGEMGLSNVLNDAANQYGKTISEEALEAAVNGELAAVKQEKTRLIDAISKGILSDSEASNKLTELREEEQNLNHELAGIKEKAAIREDWLAAIEALKKVNIKSELTRMAQHKPIIFRRLLGLFFSPNSIRVRTERIEGNKRKRKAIIEGYEFTEAVKEFNTLSIVQNNYLFLPKDKVFYQIVEITELLAA